VLWWVVRVALRDPDPGLLVRLEVTGELLLERSGPKGFVALSDSGPGVSSWPGGAR
jgi:hypothetical protein